jgi:hypothetical protein
MASLEGHSVPTKLDLPIRKFMWFSFLAAAAWVATPPVFAAGKAAPTTQASPQLTEDNLPAARALVDQVQLLESQSLLYWLQHREHQPDLKHFPRWEQLTAKTDEAGNPSAGGKFGPYLTSEPLNPLNELRDVLLVSDEAKRDEELPGRVGFVVAPDGRVWGTDATGRRVLFVQDVEHFQRKLRQHSPPPRPQSRAAQLRSTLNLLYTLQAQLELYKLQHRDRLPDFARWGEWEQLLRPTDPSGTIDEHAACGPYLDFPPENPLTGFSRVVLTTSGRKSAQELVDGKFGYVIDPKQGKVWAVDEEGHCLSTSRLPSGNSITSAGAP